MHLPSDLPHSAPPSALAAFAAAWTVEGLRQALRHELAVHPGQRTLAQEAGVGRITIRKLLSGETVHPEKDTLLRLLHWAENRPFRPVAMEAAALLLVTADIPAVRRASARVAVIDVLAYAYQAAGARRPAWIDAEL